MAWDPDPVTKGETPAHTAAKHRLSGPEAPAGFDSPPPRFWSVRQGTTNLRVTLSAIAVAAVLISGLVVSSAAAAAPRRPRVREPRNHSACSLRLRLPGNGAVLLPCPPVPGQKAAVVRHHVHPPSGEPVIHAKSGHPVPADMRQPTWDDRGYAVPWNACPVFAGQTLVRIRPCGLVAAARVRRAAILRRLASWGLPMAGAVVLGGLVVALEWWRRHGTSVTAGGGREEGGRRGFLAG
jgi:hypothetical protein